MRRPLMQLIEDLPAGIVGGHRIHVATNRFARRIHARNDGELRVRGEQKHHQHQNALRNNAAVMSAPQHHRGEKNQPAEHTDPVQPHQRPADDETGGVYPLLAKEPRQLCKRKRGQHGAKEYQGAQPDAEREIHQRMEKSSH